jgi:sorbitol-specific phosphotransferase system component IIC
MLCFEGWAPNKQFTGTDGLGRVALQACILGAVWGVHFVLTLLIVLSQKNMIVLGSLNSFLGEARIRMLLQWCVYVVMISTFHLLEFFTTAICNPGVTTAGSFLINHSLMYTGALLSSATEFWLRFLCFPSLQSNTLTIVGLVLVLLAQTVRSLAMATCGESFNHII